jgi:cytochrome c oxidase cbb3-type subunit III
LRAGGRKSKAYWIITECRGFEKMKQVGKIVAATLVGVALIALSSCEREKRQFREDPPAAPASAQVRQSELRPGSPTPAEVKQPDEVNAYALSEGKRLFDAYNCAGCHAQGGGSIGPPLMDDKWIYGSNPSNIYSTIIEGRPNGMPSFSDKIPDSQMWQIVAYVRSMSGQVTKDAAPGRSDHMSGKKPEQSKEKEKPVSERAKHPE